MSTTGKSSFIDEEIEAWRSGVALLLTGLLAGGRELESCLFSLLQHEGCFPLSLQLVSLFNLASALEEISKQKIATKPSKYYNRGFFTGL